MKQEAGFLGSTGPVAKKCALATVRATGRATVLCEDSVRAACRGATSLATKTSGFLASSMSFLNPFRTRAKADRPTTDQDEPQGPCVPPEDPSDEQACAGPQQETQAAPADTAPPEGAPPTEEAPNAMLTVRDLEQEVALLAKQKHALQEKLVGNKAALADAQRLEQEVARLTEQKDALERRVSEGEAALADARGLAQEVARLTEQKDALEKRVAEGEAALAGILTAAAESRPPEEPPHGESGALEEREAEPAESAAESGGRIQAAEPQSGGVAGVGEARGAEAVREPAAVPAPLGPPVDGGMQGGEADAGVDAPGPPPPAAPAVTAEEARAATFAGAAEKLVFRRALSALESPDEAARVDAAGVMGRVRHELSVRALASRFPRESSVPVREACVNALTRLDLKEGLPIAARALGDAAAPVRLAAVRGVYRLAGPGAAAALVPALGDDDEDVRRRAATCIGWLGDERLAHELLPLLADGSASVRSATLEAMGNLRSQVVVAEVIELLDDPEESVRKKALKALRIITGKRMADKFPKDRASRQRLLARWRAWREDEPSIGGTEQP